MADQQQEEKGESGDADAATSGPHRFTGGEVLRQVVAGTFGGISCTVIGYPFDTVKTRMQMGSKFGDVARQLTPRTLFAGILAPIGGAMPCWAAGYTGYNIGKEIADRISGRDGDKESMGLRPVDVLLGGLTSGVLVSLVKCPIDNVKVNCQNTGQGSVTVLRQILGSSGGVKNLMRGMLPTLMHTIPTNTVFFGSYDILFNSVFHEQEGVMRPLLSGGFAGVAEWSICFPFDTFKTRFQASTSSSLAACWQDLRNEVNGSQLRALMRLYSGLPPMLVRAFPANSAALVTIESTRTLLEGLSPTMN